MLSRVQKRKSHKNGVGRLSFGGENFSGRKKKRFHCRQKGRLCWHILSDKWGRWLKRAEYWGCGSQRLPPLGWKTDPCCHSLLIFFHGAAEGLPLPGKPMKGREKSPDSLFGSQQTKRRGAGRKKNPGKPPRRIRPKRAEQCKHHPEKRGRDPRKSKERERREKERKKERRRKCKIPRR